MDAVVHRVALSAALTLFLASSCAARPDLAEPSGRFVPLAVLRAEPAAGIAPPDARELATIGEERQPAVIEGPSPAVFGYRYGTAIDLCDVIAYSSSPPAIACIC